MFPVVLVDSSPCFSNVLSNVLGIPLDEISCCMSYGVLINLMRAQCCVCTPPPLSPRPRPFGGVAGGKKFMWRGILFKLADGSSEPYWGSDEAAAKGACCAPGTTCNIGQLWGVLGESAFGFNRRCQEVARSRPP